ncbi:MAG: lysophospholipid acyltransferase family protein [Saprospiraceae bacterium]
MLSSIRPWLKLLCVVVVLAYYLCRLLLLSAIRGKSEKSSFRFRKKFCRAALRILGIQYQKNGIPFPGVCLYVSNHRSMLDPLIELSWLDTYILSKAEVGNYPLLGKGAKETGVVFVDRENNKSRKAALTAIENLLKSNCPVMIYPEGTTNSADLTSEFRRGAIELAFDLSIPIVPVMIEYPDSTYYWDHESLMTYFIRIFRASGNFTVKGKIGQPVFASDKKDIVGKIQSAINTMIQEARV